MRQVNSTTGNLTMKSSSDVVWEPFFAFVPPTLLVKSIGDMSTAAGLVRSILPQHRYQRLLIPRRIIHPIRPFCLSECIPIRRLSAHLNSNILFQQHSICKYDAIALRLLREPGRASPLTAPTRTASSPTHATPTTPSESAGNGEDSSPALPIQTCRV